MRIIAHFTLFLAILSVLMASCDVAYPSSFTFNEIVDAIYKAEGGTKAKKPFGILSVPCAGYEDCRDVCFNTVRNNHRRWLLKGDKRPFLEFLGSRYAPISATNDPDNLNVNWIRNVKYFLFKKEE